MVKTRQKGNKARLEVIKYLESRGYKVAIVERTGRFIKEKDMFGLYDLVAVHSVKIGQLFIQISSNVPHTHRNFCDFTMNYKTNAACLQFTKLDNKGWNVWFYSVGTKSKKHHYKKLEGEVLWL